MTHSFIALGFNIDHVATLRQARRGRYPDPVHAALAAELAGADSVTLHLREDRRHIQEERDVRVLQDLLKTHMNLEMAVTDEMLAHCASKCGRADCCSWCPEKPARRSRPRAEGLDAASQIPRLKEPATRALGRHGIRVALFIDPDPRQIEAAAADRRACGGVSHGERIAEHRRCAAGDRSWSVCALGARLAAGLGITVHAGHGLNYHNVQPVAAIRDIVELNIGPTIVARAVFDGLAVANRDMKQVLVAARS